MLKKLISGIVLIAILVVISISIFNTKNDKLIFVCSEDNDLYSNIVNSNGEYPRVASADKALEMAAPGSGILILADNYPDQKVFLPEDFYDKVEKKRLRVYIEFPDSLPGIKTGEIQNIKKENRFIKWNYTRIIKKD